MSRGLAEINDAILQLALYDQMNQRHLFKAPTIDNASGPEHLWGWNGSISIAAHHLIRDVYDHFDGDFVMRLGNWSIVAHRIRIDGTPDLFLIAVVVAGHPTMKGINRWLRRYAAKLDVRALLA